MTHPVGFSMLPDNRRGSICSRDDCSSSVIRLLFPRESTHAPLIRRRCGRAAKKIAKFRRTNYWKQRFHSMIRHLENGHRLQILPDPHLVPSPLPLADETGTLRGASPRGLNERGFLRRNA
jgi:hypothetical protein